VLHFGGYDVLAQPFRAEEVMWAVKGAHGRWAAEAGTGASQRPAVPEQTAFRPYAFR